MPEISGWGCHEGPLVDSKNEFEVIDCQKCGFKHIIPLPEAEELEKVYQEDYYTREKPFYIEKHKEDIEWLDLVFADRYDLFEDLLPESQRSIMDIGTGPGYFLLHGKKRGWKTFGIEPSRQAAEHCRSLGIEVLEGFFDEKAALEPGTFDVIHMSKVLEHLPDPLSTISLAGSLLSGNGLLCIDVPNDYNPFQEALRASCGYEPWWVAPPHHINYFDFISLRKLLEGRGFEVIDVQSSFPIDLFLLMGDDYVKNDQLGRQCHIKRKNFELNLNRAGKNTVRKKLYRAFAECGLGREIVIYCRKE